MNGPNCSPSNNPPLNNDVDSLSEGNVPASGKVDDQNPLHNDDGGTSTNQNESVSVSKQSPSNTVPSQASKPPSTMVKVTLSNFKVPQCHSTPKAKRPRSSSLGSRDLDPQLADGDSKKSKTDGLTIGKKVLSASKGNLVNLGSNPVNVENVDSENNHPGSGCSSMMDLSTTLGTDDVDSVLNSSHGGGNDISKTDSSISIDVDDAENEKTMDWYNQVPPDPPERKNELSPGNEVPAEKKEVPAELDVD